MSLKTRWNTSNSTWVGPRGLNLSFERFSNSYCSFFPYQFVVFCNLNFCSFSVASNRGFRTQLFESCTLGWLCYVNLAFLFPNLFFETLKVLFTVTGVVRTTVFFPLPQYSSFADSTFADLPRQPCQFQPRSAMSKEDLAKEALATGREFYRLIISFFCDFISLRVTVTCGKCCPLATQII